MTATEEPPIEMDTLIPLWLQRTIEMKVLPPPAVGEKTMKSRGGAISDALRLVEDRGPTTHCQLLK